MKHFPIFIVCLMLGGFASHSVAHSSHSVVAQASQEASQPASSAGNNDNSEGNKSCSEDETYDPVAETCMLKE